MASPERAQTNDGVVQLPLDALYEILLRVLTQPLCRFRAVCRSWRSLLSDPPFVAAHAAHHRDDPPLIAVCVAAGHGRGGEASETEIRLLDMSDCSVVKRVVDAGAGPSWLLRQVRPHLDRVLIHRRIVRADHDHHHRPLRVLDPATGAVVSFPPAYDDGACSSYVFGRAVSSDGGEGEYKVLCLGAYNGTRHCRVLTVDGGHGAWRAAPMPPVAIGTLHHRRTVVAGGVVYHLLGSDGYSNDWGAIAAFDLEAEQWRPTLLQGPRTTGGPARRSLAEVNRRLAAVCCTVSTLDLWLLMGSSAGEPLQAVWCNQHRVVMSSIPQVYVLAADTDPLWVLDDGRVALCLRSDMASTGMLWMYDPRTQTCTHVANCLRMGIGVYTGNLLRQPAGSTCSFNGRAVV